MPAFVGTIVGEVLFIPFFPFWKKRAPISQAYYFLLLKLTHCFKSGNSGLVYKVFFTYCTVHMHTCYLANIDVDICNQPLQQSFVRKEFDVTAE